MQIIAEIRTPDVEFVRTVDAHVAPRSKGEPKVTYLASPPWQLQPFRIEIEPGEALESLSHAGEEFIHCVAGRLLIMVEEREWVLDPGDTIVIPAHSSHGYRNAGKTARSGCGRCRPSEAATPRPGSLSRPIERIRTAAIQRFSGEGRRPGSRNDRVVHRT